MAQFTADSMGMDFGMAQQHVATLRSLAAKFNGLLDEGKGIVTSVSSQWSGEAWTSYKATQDKWDAAAADLNLILGRITNALEQTGQDFDHNDKRSAGFFR